MPDAVLLGRDWACALEADKTATEMAIADVAIKRDWVMTTFFEKTTLKMKAASKTTLEIAWTTTCSQFQCHWNWRFAWPAVLSVLADWQSLWNSPTIGTFVNQLSGFVDAEFADIKNVDSIEKHYIQLNQTALSMALV